jgi:hypothetical protein
MPTARSRIWFGVTALCVAGGVLISVFTAAQNSTGHFSTPVERAFNTLVFFTIQSNLIVGVTVLLLALKPERSSPAFGVCRLIGVVAITVTGVVYHVALAGLFDLQGWDQLGNQLVHTVVPIMAVVGWLAFGPRGGHLGAGGALVRRLPALLARIHADPRGVRQLVSLPVHRRDQARIWRSGPQLPVGFTALARSRGRSDGG